MAASHVGSRFTFKGSTPSISWPTGGTLLFNTDRLTLDDSGNVAVKGNMAVNTNKFTVAAASGNTAIAGTLGVTSDVAVNTNKFTVAAASGNTAIAGTLGVTSDVAVNTNKFTVAAASGNTVAAGTLGVTGNVAVNTDKFNVTAATGNTAIAGDVAVATNKFTIAAASGNTIVAGTLGVTGNVAVNTDKFVVTAASGNTAIAGDVAVATNKFIVAAASGNTVVAGTLGVTGNVAVNTDKFVVTAASGNTAIAGDVAVATSKFTVAAASGNTAIAGTLGVTGDVAVATNKFTVAAASGNTAVAGTLGVTGDATVATNKFTVAGASGNTVIAGTLNSVGDLAVNTDKFTVAAASGNTAVGGTFNSVGDLSVNTNKFNVAAASGNTTVAGTFGVTGTTTLANLVVNGSFSQTTTIVNGGQYALTRAGIQSAIDAVNSAGGGAVLVKGDVTSDGTALALKSNVTLDFDNRVFKLAASSSSYHLITVVGSGASAAKVFTVNGTEGSPLVTVSTVDAATFAVGDYVLVEDLAAPDSHGQVSRLSAVDTGTGVLTLTEPLGFDYLTANTARIYRITSPINNACLRNAILDANGNTGASSSLVRWIDVINSRMENVTIRGALPSSGAYPITVYQTHRCHFSNIVARDLTTNSSTCSIGFQKACACHIRSVTNINSGGFGPNLQQSNDTTWDGLVSERNYARAFRLDTSSRCVLKNFTCNGGVGPAGTGFRMSFGTRNSTITNLTCVGNSDYGFVYDSGTANCATYGAYVASNTTGGVFFSGTNHTLWGNFSGSITDNGSTTSFINTNGGNTTSLSKFIQSNTTASSGSGSGALQVAGGSYVAKDAYFGTGAMVPTTGGTVGLFSYNEPSQTHTTNVSGPWGASYSLPMKITRVNNIVYITYGALSQTASVSTAIQTTATLPAKWRPTTQKWLTVEVLDNGTYVAGRMTVFPAGGIWWTLANGAALTGSGATGVSSSCVSYDVGV